MKYARVIIADDHDLIAGALANLVSPHFDVVATVPDGHALLSAARTLKPGLVVVDIGMPRLNGLEACRQLKAQMPGVKVVFLTMNEDVELAIEAMKTGASAYILKTSAASELLHAMQAALQGRSYVTPQISRGMQESFICNPHGRSRARSLTSRQCEVVQMLAEGKSIKEIAGLLRISPKTVEFHKYRVMQEFSIKTNADLVQFAVRNYVVSG